MDFYFHLRNLMGSQVKTMISSKTKKVFVKIESSGGQNSFQGKMGFGMKTKYSKVDNMKLLTIQKTC
jgi:hypothetical protein